MVTPHQLALPPQVTAALEELKAALVSIYGDRFRGVYLYGSYARGESHADSDVDVLIAFDGDVDPGEEIDRYSQARSEICLRHNVLIATYPVAVSLLGGRHDPFFENVRREAIAV
jgi:predicted nucleotidyltransferase